MKRLLLLFLLPLSLFAVTINVINDSEYTLEAEIYEKGDEPVGAALIPGNGTYYTWIDSYQGASDWYEGPFTVRFICPNGDEYGTIRHVTDGMTIRAQAALGQRKCPADSQPVPHRTQPKLSPHDQY